MGFNFAKAYEFVKRTVESGSGVADGMKDLIGYCEKKKPNVVWQEIRKLNVVNCDSHSTNAGLAATFPRLDCDVILVIHIASRGDYISIRNEI